MFYSRFFGFDNFCAAFENIESLHRALNAASVFNIAATLFVMILTDIIGLAALSWGSQLYITMIETLLLSLFMILLTVIEFKTARLNTNPEYEKLNQSGSDSSPFQ